MQQEQIRNYSQGIGLGSVLGFIGAVSLGGNKKQMLLLRFFSPFRKFIAEEVSF